MDFSHYLTPLFNPKNIAVIGASQRPSSVGTVLWKHIQKARNLNVFPVNPKYKTLENWHCYPSLDEISDHIDLAVVATPPSTYKKVVESCQKSKVSAILFSGGYPRSTLTKEILEKVQEAADSGILILGPHSLGFLRPTLNLNASFMTDVPKMGNIGLISQSPGLSNAIVQNVTAANGGFSCIIDPGIETILTTADFVSFLAADQRTECIALYIESFKDPRRLLTAISAAVQTKPVLILKGGRSKNSADVVIRNNGLGQDRFAVMERALIKAGAIIVDTLQQLNEAIQAFMYRRSLMVGDLYAIGNSKGIDTLLADHADFAELKLAQVEPKISKQITEKFELPHPFFNPLNLGLLMTPDKIAELLATVLALEDCAAVLLTLTGNQVQEPLQTAKAILPVIQKSPKMVISVWLGGEDTDKAIRFLNQNGLPAFDNIRAGTDALVFMKAFSSMEERKRTVLSDTPPLSSEFFAPVRKIVQKALKEKRNLLYENETKRLLASIGFKTAPCLFAGSIGEAEQAAEALGYPVAMKIRVDGVLSKSDSGGVIIGINNSRELSSAWNAMQIRSETLLLSPEDFSVVIEKSLPTMDGREIRMGIKRASQYGPIVYVGVGGLYGEIVCSDASSFVPVSLHDARAMLTESAFSALFGRYKGLSKVDIQEVASMLVKLSQLAEAVPCLRNLEIDPLLVGSKESIVLDAYATISEEDGQPDTHDGHLIFPGVLTAEPELIEGRFGALMLRPAHHSDHAMYRSYLDNLSDHSRRLRFHGAAKVSDSAVLNTITYNKDRTFTIFAVDKHPTPPAIRAEATFSLLPNGKDAEFGISVADEWQGKGLSSFLMNKLEDEARRRNIRYLFGYVLKDNLGMDGMMKKRGYEFEPDPSDPHVNLFKLDVSKK